MFKTKNYYDLIVKDAFNDADPKTAVEEFTANHKDGILIRIQESAIYRSETNDPEEDDAKIKTLVETYANHMLTQELLKDEIETIMASDRIANHMRPDLPDYEGDTLYALIPKSKKLNINTRQFNEVDQEFKTTLNNNVTYDAYRLWWD